jgi:mercuric ion transport protein
MKFALFFALLSFNVSANACPMADAAAYKTELQTVQTTAGTKLAFSVKGMTCGSCSTKINKALKEVDGVVASAVDYQSGEVHVSIDASKTNEGAVLTAITSTGFKANVLKTDS